MSEEFGYSVSFQCENEDAIKLLKEVSSCMDGGEYDEIEEKLSSSSISFESDETSKLIGNSYYGANLGKALGDHADQSCGELGVESDYGMSTLEALEPSAEGVYEICAEGTDREAYEFCKYLTIFFHALGANNLSAKASGSYWSGKWNNTDGLLIMSMEEMEC